MLENTTQAQQGTSSDSADSVGRSEDRAHHASTDATAVSPPPGVDTTGTPTTAASDPLIALERARSVVMGLLKKTNESNIHTDSNRHREMVDEELREQVCRVVIISDRHFRNRDAAVHAIGTLQMILGSFAEHQTLQDAAFEAHCDIIRLTLDELKKYPEDVLGEWEDQMARTAAILDKPIRNRSEFQCIVAQGLYHLVKLAKERKHMSHSSGTFQ